MDNQIGEKKESFFRRLTRNKLLQKIFFLFFSIWFIFSFIYIGYDQFNKFLTRLTRNAYTQGFADSVMAIVNQADNCQTVRVYYGAKEKNLIDVKCVNNLKVFDNQSKLKKK